MLWNFKNIFPYTNIHDLNLDWIMRALKTLHEMVLERSVPAGGSTNQVLSKKSNADYDTEWKDIEDNTRLWYPSVDEDGDLSWTKSDTEVAPQTVNIKGEQGPQGSQGIQGEQGPQGVQGVAGVGVPAGGSAGQVLAKQSGTDYDTAWVTAQGGGGSISPTGYYLNGLTTDENDDILFIPHDTLAQMFGFASEADFEQRAQSGEAVVVELHYDGVIGLAYNHSFPFTIFAFGKDISRAMIGSVACVRGSSNVTVETNTPIAYESAYTKNGVVGVRIYEKTSLGADISSVHLTVTAHYVKTNRA